RSGASPSQAGQASARQSAATSLRWRLARTSLRSFCLAGASDHLLDLVEFVFLELLGHAEERARRACRRAVEEDPDDLAKRGFLGGGFRDRGAVEEAALRFLALDIALVLEPLEHGAHGRSAQLVGQRLADFGDEHRYALIEDIDDLAFAGRQLAEHFKSCLMRPNRRATFVECYICSVIASPMIALIGGWGGIRTHGRLHVAGFQDRCLKPLGHPSVWSISVSRPEPSRARRGMNQAGGRHVFPSSLGCREERHCRPSAVGFWLERRRRRSCPPRGR